MKLPSLAKQYRIAVSLHAKTELFNSRHLLCSSHILRQPGGLALGLNNMALIHPSPVFDKAQKCNDRKKKTVRAAVNNVSKYIMGGRREKTGLSSMDDLDADPSFEESDKVPHKAI